MSHDPEGTEPRWGVTIYSVQFSPTFHPEGEVHVAFVPEGDATVTIVTGAGTETTALSTERSLQFLDELKALDPLGIPDGHSAGIDGITLRCHIQQENGRRTFTAWSPNAREAPRQHGFVMALHRLAMEVAREPASVRFLGQVFGYIDRGLPVKVFDEVPRRIQLFGRLSSTHEAPLNAFLASVPPNEPVLMDLSGFEMMGALLYSRFARFHARPGRTAWWVSETASTQLKAAGLPATCLHRNKESAVAALMAG